MWRRENPTKGWAPAGTQTNSIDTQATNLDGKGNYVILETEGEGNFIGMNHSVYHFQGVSDACIQIVCCTESRLGGARATT
jgi:hypothetical protein